MRPRFAILISGRGSNMSALLAHRDQIPADFVLVLSDQADAPGLAVAREAGLPVAIVARERGQTKQAHEQEMLATLQGADISHLALAGFMRILSPEFIAQFAAILNIHPALLPAFPGLETHARAIAAGSYVHGCTVHQVDGGIDTGPIVAQAGLAVQPEETATDLAARVLRLEHSLYPHALSNFLRGKDQTQRQNQGLADPGAQG